MPCGNNNPQQQTTHTVRARPRNSLSLHRACVFLSSFILPQVSRLQVCVKIKCCQKETLPPKTLGPLTQGRTPVKELWASLKLNVGKIPPQSLEITFTKWQMLSFSRNLKKLLGQVDQLFLNLWRSYTQRKKNTVLCLWKAWAIPWWKIPFIPRYQALQIEGNAEMKDTVPAFMLLIV